MQGREAAQGAPEPPHHRRSGLAALVGYVALDGVSPAVLAVLTAVAAGAILAMLADTMIPEAFERTHLYAGLIAGVGFLLAFAIERV